MHDETGTGATFSRKTIVGNFRGTSIEGQGCFEPAGILTLRSSREFTLRPRNRPPSGSPPHGPNYFNGVLYRREKLIFAIEYLESGETNAFVTVIYVRWRSPPFFHFPFDWPFKWCNCIFFLINLFRNVRRRKEKQKGMSNDGFNETENENEHNANLLENAKKKKGVSPEWANWNDANGSRCRDRNRDFPIVYLLREPNRGLIREQSVRTQMSNAIFAEVGAVFANRPGFDHPALFRTVRFPAAARMRWRSRRERNSAKI